MYIAICRYVHSVVFVISWRFKIKIKITRNNDFLFDFFEVLLDTQQVLLIIC